jgi:chitin-binding protein
VRPPVNPRISSTENGIILIWDDLRSTEPSLMGYKVYRRSGNDKDFKMMPNDTLRNDKNYYRDTSLVAGTDYTYVIRAVDYYGNVSPDSKPVSYGSAAFTPVPPVITRGVSTPDGIMLSWGQVTDKNIASVKVYRTRPGGEKQVIATLPADTDQYLDKTAESGQLYSYMISIVTADNNESSGSNEVTVRK